MGDVRLGFSLGRCGGSWVEGGPWLPKAFIFQQDDCVLLSIASTYEYLFTGEYVSISKAIEFMYINYKFSGTATDAATR